MCFDFVKPFCTQDPYVISFGNDVSPASFPLYSHNTVLDNVASTHCCVSAEFEQEGNETGRRNQ